MISVVHGAEHIFELANPDYRRLYGNRQLVGKPVREALPELSGQPFFELLDNVYKTGIPFIGNEILANIARNLNGIVEDVYFNFIYQPIFNKEKQVEGITVFAHDITEQVMARKKIELLVKKLEESESKYKNLSEFLEIKVQERTKELLSANNQIS